MEQSPSLESNSHSVMKLTTLWKPKVHYLIHMGPFLNTTDGSCHLVTFCYMISVITTWQLCELVW